MVSDFLAAVLKMSIKKNPVDLLFLFCVKKRSSCFLTLSYFKQNAVFNQSLQYVAIFGRYSYKSCLHRNSKGLPKGRKAGETILTPKACCFYTSKSKLQSTVQET